MFELTVDNAAAYLERRPGSSNSRWRITPLGGGVSNTVLLVESSAERFVLKQSLPKLRVEEEWLADRSRVLRECEAMRALAPHFSAGIIPGIVFEDPENFLFAMEAAPAGSRTWKSLLLDGVAEETVAEKVAIGLTAMFRASWDSPDWGARFGDQTAFGQLRLDPYYRFTAARNPDLAEHFEARIHDARTRRRSLVHGDWSPKNFLVHGDRVMAIDFEVIHYGDPAFDAAFLLNHLLLKSFHQPQWADRFMSLADRFIRVVLDELPALETWFEKATCAHLGCLLLARIDGKSPAEYIRDESLKKSVREYARALIPHPPDTVQEIFRNALK